ncbi:MAG: hypothetical protein M3022_16035 [Actinomycetota bacterium]|nr:hypothetical protein [Actinomycetota bacterium]
MSARAVALPLPLVKLWRHPIRWLLIKLRLLGWAVVLTYIGVLIVAGLYYLLFEVNPAFTKLWHQAVSDNALRHNIRNVGEGFLGGLLAQQVVWNHFRKQKPKNLLDRTEIALHIPNVKDDRRLSVGLVFVPLLAIAYAAPGFLAALWISHRFHSGVGHLSSSASHLHVHLTPHLASVWAKTKASLTRDVDKRLMGFAASFFFGRRPARGAFDDVQLWFAERHVALGKPIRWYHPPTFAARCNDIRGREVAATQTHHGRWQSAVMLGAVAVSLALAGLGWYALNYLAK